MILWQSLTQTCSSRGCFLWPAQVKVIDLVFFCGDSWLGPGPTEVTGLSLVLWRLLTHAYSHKGHPLGPALVEVVNSALLLWCSCLRPVPTKVISSGLLLLRLFAWACSQAWRHFLNCYFLFSDDSILNQIDAPSHHIYVKAENSLQFCA